MPVRFPAPWLMGVSSAGQQFTDAFLGARMMKLQRIRQQEEAQRHKEELAIRRQTMEEMGEYRKSQAKHQETADFIHFVTGVAKEFPDVAAKILQSPEAKKMIPALSTIGPWVTGDSLGKAMESVRRMEEEYAARGLSMPPGLLETVITEAITGTKLAPGLFKEKGGADGGGRGGAGGAAGLPVFWRKDAQGNPVVWDAATNSWVPFDPNDPSHLKHKGAPFTHVGETPPKLSPHTQADLLQINKVTTPEEAARLNRIFKAQNKPLLTKQVTPQQSMLPAWLGGKPYTTESWAPDVPAEEPTPRTLPARKKVKKVEDLEF